MTAASLPFVRRMALVLVLVFAPVALVILMRRATRRVLLVRGVWIAAKRVRAASMGRVIQ